MTNISNERSGITTTGSIDIKRIREYHEQVYANIFYNLDEMDKFLKRCKLLEFNQE